MFGTSWFYFTTKTLVFLLFDGKAKSVYFKPRQLPSHFRRVPAGAGFPHSGLVQIILYPKDRADHHQALGKLSEKAAGEGTVKMTVTRPSFFMPFIAAKGGTAFEIAQQSVLNVSAVSVVYDRCCVDRDSHDLAAAGNLSG